LCSVGENSIKLPGLQTSGNSTGSLRKCVWCQALLFLCYCCCFRDLPGRVIAQCQLLSMPSWYHYRVSRS
jgi:hypothetical protein